MPFNIPAGQSRYICWLGNDLLLTGSSFATAAHTFAALSETNGALTSWKAGRGLNSLPSSTLFKLKTYQVTAGTAILTLPDHVAGLGGTPDLQFLGSGPPTPTTPTTPSGTTPQGTIAFTAPAANASLTAGSITISGTYTLTSGALTNGIQYRWNTGTWTTLVASPTGGTFSQAVNITTSATGALEVRFADNTAVAASRNVTIAASPTPTPGGTSTASGTTGTLTLTTPVNGANVAAGNMSLVGSYTVASGQEIGALEWKFGNQPWRILRFGPITTSGTIDELVENEESGSGVFRLRFANEQAVEVSVNVTVAAPTSPNAVSTQSISIPLNSWTNAELTANWNAAIASGVSQIQGGNLIPSGAENINRNGRVSYKTPFALTSTASNFSLATKLKLDSTTAAFYNQGFGISIHNDLTPAFAGNMNADFGLRDLTKALHLEFSPVDNAVGLRHNPSNFTYIGGYEVSATLTGGKVLVGDVWIWVDLVATTHVLNVYIANSSTKPGTPDLTFDVDASSIGSLATYFGNQAFLAIGAYNVFNSESGSPNKAFKFESLSFTASAT